MELLYTDKAANANNFHQKIPTPCEVMPVGSQTENFSNPKKNFINRNITYNAIFISHNVTVCDVILGLSANQSFMHFCIKSSIGTQGEVGSWPPTTPVVYSTDRFKAVVQVLVLLFVALWFILQSDLFCLALCYFVLVFCSSFSIVITSLGEERANLSAFCMFVWFALVWFCLFPLPLGVWEGLWLVIVALPGLFSYPFF